MTPASKINSFLKSEREPFNLTFEKVLLTYLVGGLIGTIWEMTLELFRKHQFLVRSGSFFTPFNPVYGFGLVLILLCLNKVKKNYSLFLYGCLLGGGAEYLLSFLQEKLLGSKSWDYTGKFLNINGRTTIVFCVFWGFAAFLIIRFFFPILFNLLDRVDPNLLRVIAIVGTFVIVVDLFMTSFGLLRYTQRLNNIPPKTLIGIFIDNFLPDKIVEYFFSNMKPV